jgi:pre-mRNA-splicing factor ATP-dependent RNA helicase DHX38/PRP16
MEPSLSKILIASVTYGCSSEVLTIVSMLSVPSVFYRPKERMEESDAAREKFFVQESDHLTLLHCYTQWKLNGYRDAWCQQHFLHAKILRKAREVVSAERLPCPLPLSPCSSLPLATAHAAGGHHEDAAPRDHVVRHGLGPGAQVHRHGLLPPGCARQGHRRVCACAHRHAAAAVSADGEERRRRRADFGVTSHPTSAIMGAGITPQFLVFHEVIQTSKTYMHTCTAVEPQWLAEMYVLPLCLSALALPC